MSVNEKMTTLADAIRMYTNSADKLSLDEMAEKIPSIYDNGFSGGEQKGYMEGYGKGNQEGYNAGIEEGYTNGQKDGLAAGIEEGIEQGKQAEYDRAWDAYQQNGTRLDYTFGFAGVAWNETTFFPKHNITARNCHSMFYYNEFAGSLKERLEQLGIAITFPNAQPITKLYNGAKRITELGVQDFSTCKQTNPSGVFAGMAALLTIEKVIVPETLTSYSSWFSNDTTLANITFGGIINGSINFQHCPLTAASMKDIILHLANLTGTGKEYTLTLTFAEISWSNLEADSTAPTGTTWREYVREHLCWNA